MLRAGRVGFGEMDAVVVGKPAAEAIAEEARRYGAQRVFLMVSGTLNRTTGEIDNVRAALGNRCAGVFARMPPNRHAAPSLKPLPQLGRRAPTSSQRWAAAPLPTAPKPSSSVWRTTSAPRRHSTITGRSKGQTTPSGRRHANPRRSARLPFRPPSRPGSSALLPASPTSVGGSRSSSGIRRSFRAP